MTLVCNLIKPREPTLIVKISPRFVAGCDEPAANYRRIAGRNVVGDVNIDIVARTSTRGGNHSELCQIAVLKPPATDQLHGKECLLRVVN